MPLLPLVSLVLAIGVVAYALSTQQISLNFSGGPPSGGRYGAAQNDGQISQRGNGDRASRDGRRAGELVVAFRVLRTSSNGFSFTATVANRGTRPVPRWMMTFEIPEATITSGQGDAVVRPGRVVRLHSRSGDPALAPGRSITVNLVAEGVAGTPATCQMNGGPCTRV